MLIYSVLILKNYTTKQPRVKHAFKATISVCLLSGSEQLIGALYQERLKLLIFAL